MGIKLKLADQMMPERIEDLTRKVVQVCVSCGHAKWQGGVLTCDRKKSECHSKRVRKWLEEIKRLEAGLKVE